jgi:hypothetical protein
MYWSTCARNRNFGDVLSVELVEKFTGIRPTWSTAAESDLVCIGSIMDHLPPKYTGTVLGTGQARAFLDSDKADLRGANVLALRGPLTLKAVKLNPDADRPILADPGLLASDLLDEQPEQEHEVGYILHYADRTTKVPEGAKRIYIHHPVRDVIREAASCKSIISSSLHGVILADSLHLPRMWVRYPKVQGKGFKFLDYSKSFNTRIEEGRWDKADPDMVEIKKEKLRKAFRSLHFPS